MSIDVSQFYKVFFEEAEEHLANLEQLLLDVDLADPDPEDLNAIFRAAHSIKGSAGTFGFQDLAEVTHVLETLLDRIRKNEMTLTEDMVDAFLEAGDVLKNLVAAHQGDAVADREAAASVCARIEAFMREEEPAQAPTAPAVDTASALAASVVAPVHVVRFVPDARIAESEAVMRNVLAEIGSLGSLEVIEEGAADGVSPWCLHVDAAIDPAKLSGLLEFIAAEDSIRIDAAQAAPAAPAADDAFGFFEPESAAATSASGDAWGLFNESGETSGAAPQADADVATVAADSQAEDGSFGLFAPAETPAAAQPAAAEQASDGSFGFFAPVGPAGAGAPAEVAPVAAVAVEAAPAPVLETPKAPRTRAASASNQADKGSIRVNVDKVDQMINLVGELVITQAMLSAAAEKVDPVIFERLINGLAQLERNTRDLQESVMSIRMMPISVVFSRFPRVVRDLSGKLGKSVELKMTGESTELDKSLIERITDPLTHLVRNSLDHGIESPEARLAAGKPATGTITLKASHQSGNIVIEVGDDGGGLKREKILAKATERGLPVNPNMTDAEVWQLIFEPGFSTADQVTEVSGRGVGMDVVKRNITEMGGRVDIESMAGVGTRITVRLPLTLAILDGMSVGVGDETYIIPLNYVIESLQPSAGQIRSLAGSQRVIQVRGEYLPVVALHEQFNCHGAEHEFERGIMIVLEADGAKTALFVDALLGQHQVVIKNLEANFRRVPGISGATIMGDGRVALILDAVALVAMRRSANSLAA